MQSPIKEFHSPNMTMTNGISKDLQAGEPRPVSQEANRAVRKSDPMSFASILSSSNQDAVPPQSAVTNEVPKIMTQSEVNHLKADIMDATPDFIKSDNPKVIAGTLMLKHEAATNGQDYETPKHIPLPRKTLTGPENENVIKAMAQIEEAPLSDLEGPGFEEAKEKYEQRRRKRGREHDEVEESKRKVSCSALRPASNH